MKKVIYYRFWGVLIILLGNYSDTPSFFPLYINYIIGSGLIIYSFFLKKEIKEEKVYFNWKKGLIILVSGLLIILTARKVIKHFEYKGGEEKKTDIIYSSDGNNNKDSIGESVDAKMDSLLK